MLMSALLAACAAEGESDAPSAPPSGGDPSSPSATPQSTASDGTSAPEPTPLVAVDAPGRPYDADDILALMADSRRPGGVPGEVQTPEIAAAIADQVWTIGGEPWAVASIGGSCGSQACDLEVAGAPGGLAGEDLYLFRVDPATGSAELVQSVLLGLDPDTVEALDRLVRDRYDGDLDGFGLATVRWLPPPDDGRFVLAYRSGGEEGSPALDLVLDLATGEVSEMPAS
jgi:hypothetical protein